MSEWMSKWPSTSLCIFGYSGPQCSCEVGKHFDEQPRCRKFRRHLRLLLRRCPEARLAKQKHANTHKSSAGGLMKLIKWFTLRGTYILG